MTLPAGITTCTITVEPPVDFDGDTTVVKLTWQPVLNGNPHAGVPKSIVWEATGQALISFAETAESTDGGSLVFEVPHVDQAGFIDGSGDAFTDWAYRATVSAKQTSPRKTYTRTKDFQVFVGQSDLKFDLIDDGQITVPVTAPTARVTSVNGQTGAVTVPDAADIDALAADISTADGKADAAQTDATAALAGLADKAESLRR